MKLFSSLVTYGVFLLSVSAHADFKSFSKSEYDTAIKSGHTLVVDFHASWCPTCKKQEPILNEIVNMKGYETVVALKADFDKEKDLKKMGMNTLLSVGQGSANPPRLIELHYLKGPKNQKPLMLIGKGITFDSGGISLKPA